MVSDEEIKGILHPNIIALITYKVTLHLRLPRFLVYFTLNGTNIYNLNMFLYWRKVWN